MNYAPPPIPMISSEYPFGIEITEQNDPTVEDEEIFEKNHEIESEVSCDELEERECD